MANSVSRVAIIDFGSQFTKLIARRVRFLGVYSEIFNCHDTHITLTDFDAFIISGGPATVDDSSFPAILTKILEYNERTHVPVLGICFGFQAIGYYFKANLEIDTNKEFGRTLLKAIPGSVITRGAWDTNTPVVWMSHADSITTVPHGFTVVGTSLERNNIAIMENNDRKIYCMQFHPEVTHSDGGTAIISNFLDIAGCKRNWNMSEYIPNKIQEIRAKVGHRKVISAISGGVDSSVASTLMYQAIKEQLTCIFINTGMLRKNESNDIMHFLSKQLHIPIVHLDCSALFLGKLSGITDPETKRKIVGNTFIEVFEHEAKKIGGVHFLAQGTLYTDMVESGMSATSSGISGTKIKSHHNVGGLPEKMNLELIEPLSELFKDEVRILGKELGLPESIVMRHPFPGPGLSIRVLGEVTAERISILQEADDIYISGLKEYGLYDKIWQAFAVLLPISTVGVMGDNRTYESVCVLRAVTSEDGMTASAFPMEVDNDVRLKFLNFLDTISNRIINRVDGINRIVYDVTSKPPATIEWE